MSLFLAAAAGRPAAQQKIDAVAPTVPNYYDAATRLNAVVAPDPAFSQLNDPRLIEAMADHFTRLARDDARVGLDKDFLRMARAEPQFIARVMLKIDNDFTVAQLLAGVRTDDPTTYRRIQFYLDLYARAGDTNRRTRIDNIIEGTDMEREAYAFLDGAFTHPLYDVIPAKMKALRVLARFATRPDRLPVNDVVGDYTDIDIRGIIVSNSVGDGRGFLCVLSKLQSDLAWYADKTTGKLIDLAPLEYDHPAQHTEAYNDVTTDEVWSSHWTEWVDKAGRYYILLRPATGRSDRYYIFDRNGALVESGEVPQ